MHLYRYRKSYQQTPPRSQPCHPNATPARTLLVGPCSGAPSERWVMSSVIMKWRHQGCIGGGGPKLAHKSS